MIVLSTLDWTRSSQGGIDPDMKERYSSVRIVPPASRAAARGDRSRPEGDIGKRPVERAGCE
jgi:hypothetical protein